MTQPLIVEVTRGGVVESRHEIDAVVVGVDGNIERSFGHSQRPVLPRSAIKPLQAAPLVTTGCADALGLLDSELALACASHNGEPHHHLGVERWLDRIGMHTSQLECGVHPPIHRPSADALVAAGTPATALHNNCSGKHAGFLSLCTHLGYDPTGYITPTHPVQRDHVTPAIEELCRVDLSAQQPGTDGCGIPVWTLGLHELAGGWARATRRGAGQRIFATMTQHPREVAGTDRACTRMMQAAAGAAAVKTGAEGVYCAALLDSGLGVAVKARDGATRASEAAVEWLLDKLGALDDTGPHVLRNWVGTEVGEVRVAGRT